MKLNLGKFQDAQGNILSEPGLHEPFPIRCGPWPNPHKHALQRMCSICGDPVGLSPKGWAYHEAQPTLRPLCCNNCFNLLVEALQMLKVPGC